MSPAAIESHYGLERREGFEGGGARWDHASMHFSPSPNPQCLCSTSLFPFFSHHLNHSQDTSDRVDREEDLMLWNNRTLRLILWHASFRRVSCLSVLKRGITQFWFCLGNGNRFLTDVLRGRRWVGDLQQLIPVPEKGIALPLLFNIIGKVLYNLALTCLCRVLCYRWSRHLNWKWYIPYLLDPDAFSNMFWVSSQRRLYKMFINSHSYYQQTHHFLSYWNSLVVRVL